LSNTWEPQSNPRVCFTAPFQVVLQQDTLSTQAAPNQMLVRCLYSLISPGTELAMYTHTHIGFSDPTNTYAKYPFYAGYTAVGQVEAVGADVQDFAPGDIVYYPGYHQRYSLVSPHQMIVLHVPSDLPLIYVPFARMAEISYTSVLMSTVKEGDQVAVLGLGLVGNLAAQLFLLQGASVIGIDLVASRRRLASEAGIVHTVNAEAQDVVRAVYDLTDGEGADIVVEATGSPKTVSLALEMTREQGEVILLGSTRGLVELDVYNHIHRRGVTLKGAHGRLVPRRASDGRIDQVAVNKLMLQLLQNNRLKVDHLVTECVLPVQSEIERAYQSLLDKKESTMAILIDWT
jgi:2-desacetyl-2-hydroxyethyl bacteriochlorophyllide A dehydrogenase